MSHFGHEDRAARSGRGFARSRRVVIPLQRTWFSLTKRGFAAGYVLRMPLNRARHRRVDGTPGVKRRVQRDVRTTRHSKGADVVFLGCLLLDL
jgi:hypothetical protein